VLYITIFMSVNRSVQAAQRRRAGPPEPTQMRNGPSTSINSAQLFANQAKPGNGPSIPVSKMGGQQSNMSRQQYEQQNAAMAQSQSQFSKMTVPQAITLITLRLGKVESMLQNQSLNMPSGMMGMTMEGDENDSDIVQIDSNVLQSIMSRLEALEKRSSVSSGASGPELTLLKQQVETFKPILTQTKNSTASIVKEHKEFKSQVDALRTELEETKELVIALQNLTMDNSQKLLTISMSSDQLLEGFDQQEDIDAVDMEVVDEELVEPADSSAIDLKELVKQEFNLEA
jgi:hypothetical protein